MSSPAAAKRGAFIVIEGLDRSGKSTQAAALLERLDKNGVRAVLQKFPGRYIRCLNINPLKYSQIGQQLLER